MSLLLGCIADDFTGATDLANTLARQGMSTVVLPGVPRDDFMPPDADAIVIALKSRSPVCGLISVSPFHYASPCVDKVTRACKIRPCRMYSSSRLRCS